MCLTPSSKDWAGYFDINDMLGLFLWLSVSRKFVGVLVHSSSTDVHDIAISMVAAELQLS